MRMPHLEQVRATKALPPEGGVRSMGHAPEMMNRTYANLMRGLPRSTTIEEALGL